MELNYKAVVIIPARGGSKGIKKKNIRWVNGKPLLSYAINSASQSKYVNDIYVTSDDDTILRIAKILGAKTIKRPRELAGDEIPLDPVVHHAVNAIEQEYNVKYDIIVTLQPTVPLITAEDLDSAIEKLIEENYDTIVFASEATHLYWIEDRGRWRPLIRFRENRQFMPRIAKELGALITWRRCLKAHTRFGSKVGIYLVSEEKEVDVDSHVDMLVAEALLRRYKILFIVDGKRATGLGHIYRCLTLAERLHGHNILFLTNGDLGERILAEWGYSVERLDSLEKAITYIFKVKPDIVINDILDTSEKYMKSLRECTDALIVNFEDLGEGAIYADLVFNALYEFSSPPPNHYYGYKYFILRDEFRLFPIKEYTDNTKLTTLTVIFGGVDLNNLTTRTLHVIEELDLKNVNVNVIGGPGYMHLDKLTGRIKELLEKDYRIKLYSSPNFIADIIHSSDLIITSNGRTLYEAKSYAIPAISIAQNERELMHPFAHINKGVRFLGLANNMSDDHMADAIMSFIQNPDLLVKMNRSLIPYAKDLRKGVKRVLRIISDRVAEHGSN